MESFLVGRVAWVTGGATGMGRAIALELARAGADVVIGSLLSDGTLPPAAYAARPDRKQLSETADRIRAAGVRCHAEGLDLRSDASVETFHRGITDTLGPVDILVNAAGVSAQEPMMRHSDETWAAVIDVNLTGAYRAIKRCLPDMIARRWGRIVNIGSTAANVGHPRHSAYCASKAGLLGLSRCVALEGVEHGVTCNVVNPGSVGTEMMRLGSLRRIAQGGQGSTVEENFARVAAAMPQKRLIQPEEIAALVLFLCRDEALGLTMEDIAVAGGALW